MVATSMAARPYVRTGGAYRVDLWDDAGWLHEVKNHRHRVGDAEVKGKGRRLSERRVIGIGLRSEASRRSPLAVVPERKKPLEPGRSSLVD